MGILAEMYERMLELEKVPLAHKMAQIERDGCIKHHVPVDPDPIKLDDSGEVVVLIKTTEGDVYLKV